MNQLDKELRDYKARENEIAKLRDALNHRELQHGQKTFEVFGIAPGRTASVEGMIDAIKKVTALQTRRYIHK